MNFDAYARQYDLDLDEGIRLSGEGKEFFARGRLQAVREHFGRLGLTPRRALDFGCGTGTNAGIMAELWPECRVWGIDISTESLAVAKEHVRSERVCFLTPDEFNANVHEPMDWVFTSGVLHHIPVPERDTALQYIRGLIGMDGCFTIFENNPFNPGARLVMRRIPFDRDAVMVNPYGLVSTLRSLDYAPVTCRFLFVFPRPLKAFRALEPALSRVPVGAQYGVFARTPRGVQ